MEHQDEDNINNGNKVAIPASRRRSRPRLYHRKSRHGCWRCRQRRVKCDQFRPDCVSSPDLHLSSWFPLTLYPRSVLGTPLTYRPSSQNNCRRHNVSCHYDRGHEDDIDPLAKSPRNTRAASKLNAVVAPVPYTPVASEDLFTADDTFLLTSLSTFDFDSSPLPCPSISYLTPRPSIDESFAGLSDLPLAQLTPPTRHLELLILHNFTVHTAATLAGTDSPSLLECWCVQVPKLAIGYEPLLNALLAFSAQHMLASPPYAPDAAAATTACRAAYLDSALRHHRETLRSSEPLTPPVADATCLTSVLLMVDALAALRDRELAPYRPPSTWLGIGRGVRLVLDNWAYPLEKAYPAAAVLTVLRESAELATPSLLFHEAHLHRFPYLLLDPSRGGGHADDAEEEKEEEQEEEVRLAYREMVGYLGMLQAAIEGGDAAPALAWRIAVFATIVPQAFVEQLDAGRPRAMVVIAHFWALAALVSAGAGGGLWWVGGTPWREVDAIRRNIPLEWEHLVEWPLRVLADVQRMGYGGLCM